MEMTKEQFKNQNLNWEDEFYEYAIHKTDGGAMYLYQAEKPLKKTVSPLIIRLDGADREKLSLMLKFNKGEI
jgi:hypothetical protein